MNKPLMVHVVTNFSAAGGGEMMLARLIKQTQHNYDHIIIVLMRISETYQEAIDLCKASYSLNWNGINSILVALKLRKIIKQLNPDTIQSWMYHANVFTSLSTLNLINKPRILGNSSFFSFFKRGVNYNKDIIATR